MKDLLEKVWSGFGLNEVMIVSGLVFLFFISKMSVGSSKKKKRKEKSEEGEGEAPSEGN
jgi:hypothetical protein